VDIVETKEAQTCPRQHETIEFICNDPRGGKWKLFGIKSTAPYHPEVLWSEIQSWSKECSLEDMEYWHIWDEKGLVNPKELRLPRDGERFAILLQANGNQEDIV
jgi:hypothetical protein